MEQFCPIFAVWVQIWPLYTLCKWKEIIEKSFWTGPFNLPFVSELSTVVTFYRLKQAMEIHFRCLCPNFTTLCRWKQIIEKSLWTGPFNLHRFRSSQRWWHFSPLSRRGKMEQFCSTFAVWVKIWQPYTLCKWKQIMEKIFWTGSFNLPLVSELSTIVTFYRLKQAMENGAMLLHFRCLCPNFTTLCRWKQIIEKSLWTGPFNLP